MRWLTQYICESQRDDVTEFKTSAPKMSNLRLIKDYVLSCLVFMVVVLIIWFNFVPVYLFFRFFVVVCFCFGLCFVFCGLVLFEFLGLLNTTLY